MGVKSKHLHQLFTLRFIGKGEVLEEGKQASMGERAKA